MQEWRIWYVTNTAQVYHTFTLARNELVPVRNKSSASGRRHKELSMSTEENKTVVRRFADAFTNRDLAGLNEVLAPDLAKEVIEQWFPENDATTADHRVGIVDIMAEGDRVSALMATSGRHIGEWMGLPATGKAWTNQVAAFCRVADGKIVEWVAVIPDTENVISQLGGVLSAAPR
jgi:ketosteroid isomerase-like protein